MRPLTSRQRQVLLLAANGNTNRRIARWLGVTPNSVAEILTAAYRRLGAADRAQAVAVALAVGEIGIGQIHIPGQQPHEPRPRPRRPTALRTRTAVPAQPEV